MRDYIKVLFVNGGLMDMGGVSSFMMNYYNHIDKSKVHIDFLTHGTCAGIRDDEIVSQGGNVYVIPPKSKDYLTNVKRMREILISEKYDIVHAHADSGNAHILKIAKECGVPVRISHSHNTDHTVVNPIRRFIADFQKKRIKRYATHLLACSKEAGEWLYGEEVPVINNAISTSDFSFNLYYRNEVREKYCIGDNLLIGCVGRLDYQKNQAFLLEVLSEVVKLRKDVRLMLVGDGILRSELETKMKALSLEDYVIFAGQISNINKYYSAFDIFTLPSIFEGFGMVVIEALCSNCPCLISDRFPKSVQIDERIVTASIDDITEWVNYISNFNVVNDRLIHDGIKTVSSNGFDIVRSANKLTNFYFDIMSSKNESISN